MNKTMSKTTSTTHGSYRVTAPPGTSEYNRQFRRQRLWAVDAMLSLWFVRIAFGVFAIFAVGALVAFWQDATVVDVSLLGATLFLSLSVLEFGNIALRGKSFYLRFVMSGGGPKNVGSSEGCDQ